ncbi:MAG: 4,5-dihydroxyphthalate decarboxylase, partial [Bradyrhizobium sp.]|nr:4,5-dihydroxyphthalate decarboxylase [Bradyrhizobium sp.]
SGPVTLKTNLADYAMTKTLKSGAVKSDLVTFDFCGPKVANQGFKAMVRERKYDTGELAIGTFLEARTYGKPVTLLPAVVMGRFQHSHALRATARGAFGPGDIEGKRIGIRSYTQTTGIWVRGIFKHEYGVDLNKVTWVCNDDGHLAEFKDPPNVERTPPDGKKVDQMLLDAEIDGAILGSDVVDDPRVAHLIPNPKDAALAWHKKYNTIPVNHLFCVDKALADTRPDVVAEIFRMLKETKAAMPKPADGIDFHPFGLEALRKPLDMMIQYSVEQKIIPRSFTVDELFDDSTRGLS